MYMSLINQITTTGTCVVTIFTENNPIVLNFTATEGTSSIKNFTGIYLSNIQAIRIKNTIAKTNTIVLSDGTTSYTYTSNKSGLNKRFDFSNVGTYSNEFLLDDLKIPPVSGVDEHIIAETPLKTSLSIGGKIGVSHFADNVYVGGNTIFNGINSYTGQPMFKISASSKLYINYPAKISYNNIEFIQGGVSNYNVTTYTYTIGSSGIYLFYADFFNATNSFGEATIYRMRNTVTTNISAPGGKRYLSTSTSNHTATCSYNCQEGDIIYVGVSSGTIGVDTNNYFYGIKIG